MSLYYNTLKQLGFNDCNSRQNGKGRISNFSSISRQLFKAHYDGYHPRMSRQLATALKRYINTRPKYERRTSEFVDEIRRKILCLHEYNVQIAKVKYKYPRSEQFDAVLLQYVELECGLLYDTYKEVNEEHENNVTQRVLRLLRLILHDALHSNDVPLKTTIQACDKALLKFFANVRADYKSENKLVANTMVKLLHNLNLLDEVNQLKGKNVSFQEDTFLRDPLVCTIRQTLATSDYESDLDDDEDDLISVFDETKNIHTSNNFEDLQLKFGFGESHFTASDLIHEVRNELPDLLYPTRQKSKENNSHVQNSKFNNFANESPIELCFSDIFKRPVNVQSKNDKNLSFLKSNSEAEPRSEDTGNKAEICDKTPFFKRPNVLSRGTNQTKIVPSTLPTENRKSRGETFPIAENAALGITVQKTDFQINSEIDQLWKNVNNTSLTNKANSIGSPKRRLKGSHNLDNTDNSVKPMDTTNSTGFGQKSLAENLIQDQPEVIEIIDDVSESDTTTNVTTTKSIKREVVDSVEDMPSARATTSADNFTIDLVHLPDNFPSAAKSQINGGIITIELLDDDDDNMESTSNEIAGSYNNSPLNLLESSEIKQEENEENRSPNFPVPNSDDEQNFLNSDKSSRSSNSSGVNRVERNQNKDSAKEADASILISDSEDELLEDASESTTQVLDNLSNTPEDGVQEINKEVCVKESYTSVLHQQETDVEALEMQKDDEKNQQQGHEENEEEQGQPKTLVFTSSDKDDQVQSQHQDLGKSSKVEKVQKINEDQEIEVHNDIPNVIDSSSPEKVIDNQNEVPEVEQQNTIETDSLIENKVPSVGKENVISLTDGDVNLQESSLHALEELGSEVTLETDTFTEMEQASDVHEKHSEFDINTVRGNLTKLIEITDAGETGIGTVEPDNCRQEVLLHSNEKLEINIVQPASDTLSIQLEKQQPESSIAIQEVVDGGTIFTEPIEMVPVPHEIVQTVVTESQTIIESSDSETPEATKHVAIEPITVSDESPATGEYELHHVKSSEKLTNQALLVNEDTETTEFQPSTLMETSIAVEIAPTSETINMKEMDQSEQNSRSQGNETVAILKLQEIETEVVQPVEECIIYEHNRLGNNDEEQSDETIVALQPSETATVVCEQVLECSVAESEPPESNIESQTNETSDMRTDVIELVECVVPENDKLEQDNEPGSTLEPQEIETEICEPVECIVFENDQLEQSSEGQINEITATVTIQTSTNIDEPALEFAAPESDQPEPSIENQSNEAVTNSKFQEVEIDFGESAEERIVYRNDQLEQSNDTIATLKVQEVEAVCEPVECIVSENDQLGKNTEGRSNEITATLKIQETTTDVGEPLSEFVTENNQPDQNMECPTTEAVANSKLQVIESCICEPVECIISENNETNETTANLNLKEMEAEVVVESVKYSDSEINLTNIETVQREELVSQLDFSVNKQHAETVQSEHITVPELINEAEPERKVIQTTAEISATPRVQREKSSTPAVEENVEPLVELETKNQSNMEEQKLLQIEEKNVIEEVAYNDQSDGSVGKNSSELLTPEKFPVSKQQDSVLVIEEPKMVESEVYQAVTCEAIDYSVTSQYLTSLEENSTTCISEVHDKKNEFPQMPNNLPLSNLDEQQQSILSSQIPSCLLEPSHIPKVQDENSTVHESISYSLSSTITEAEYDAYNAEKKGGIELLAHAAALRETLAVKTDNEKEVVDTSNDVNTTRTLNTIQTTPRRRKSNIKLDPKKKSLLREPLPRTVKQIQAKHPMKYEVDEPNTVETVTKRITRNMGIEANAEEMDNKRVTRNMGIKAKADTEVSKKIQKPSRTTRSDDSKYKPHDFISVENSILSPRTNNVYAQKRLIEANTTSEDSNDSCESTLFIDLGDNVKQSEKMKSVYEEDTICDMLEFISTEDKASVCISIPENEGTVSDSFLREMENFVDNNNLKVIPTVHVDIEDKNKSPTKSEKEVETQTKSDQDCGNAVANALFDNFKSEQTKEAKRTEIIKHSIEYILHKKLSNVERKITVPSISVAGTEENALTITTTAKEVLHGTDNSDTKTPNVTTSEKRVASRDCETNKLDKPKLRELSSEEKKSSGDVVSTSITETPVVFPNFTSEQEQVRPANLTSEEIIISVSKIEENSEKTFKTKAAMKAYEDRSHPNPYVLLHNLDSKKLTVEPELGVRTRSRSKSSEHLLKIIPSDRSRSSSVDMNSSTPSVDSSHNKSTSSSGLDESRESNDDLRDKCLNQNRDSELNLSCDSHEKVEIVNSKQFTSESLETDDEKKDLLSQVKISHNETVPYQSIESVQESNKEANQVKQSLQQKDENVTESVDTAEQELIAQNNVTALSLVKQNTKDMPAEVNALIPEVIVSSEPKGHESIQATKESPQEDDILLRSIQSKIEANKTSPEIHSKTSKTTDEAKGRSLENTIKKMKEKIEEDAKKESGSSQTPKKSENKPDALAKLSEKNDLPQTDPVSKQKSNLDKKQCETSPFEDRKETNKEEPKRRRSRSSSKSRSLDKKSERKSSSQSSDKRSKHHSDNESDTKRRSYSKSLDDKGKSKRHHSDNEIERKRRSQSKTVDDKDKINPSREDSNGQKKGGSRSPSKSKSSTERSKSISAERSSSRHKTSESKEKLSQEDKKEKKGATPPTPKPDKKDTSKNKNDLKGESKAKGDENSIKVKSDVPTVDKEIKNSSEVAEKTEHRSSKTRSQKQPKPLENNSKIGKVEDKSFDSQSDKSQDSIKSSDVIQKPDEKDKHRHPHKTRSKERSRESQTKPVHEAKPNDSHKKDDRSKDKSRRSHSKEKIKLEGEARVDKREKISKEKHKDEKSESPEDQEIEKRKDKIKEKEKIAHSDEKKEQEKLENKTTEKTSVRHTKRKSHSSEKSKSRIEENGGLDRDVSENKQNVELKSSGFPDPKNKSKICKLDVPKKRKYDGREDNSIHSDQNKALSPDPIAKIAKTDPREGNFVETTKEQVATLCTSAETGEIIKLAESFFTEASKSPTTLHSKIPAEESVLEVPVNTDAKTAKVDERVVKTNDIFVEVSKAPTASVASRIPTAKRALEDPVNVKAKIAKKDQRVVKTTESSLMEISTESAATVSKIPSDERVSEEPISGKAKIDQSVAKVTQTGLVDASKEPAAAVVSKIPTEERLLEAPVNVKAKIAKKGQSMVKTTESSLMEISTESAATVVSKILNAERVLEESMSVKAKMDQCVAKATETTGLVEASKEPAATVSKIPTEERVLKIPVNAKAKVTKKDQRMVKTTDSSSMEISTESAATVVSKIPNAERVLEESMSVKAKMDQCVVKATETTGLVEASKEPAATVVSKIPTKERVLKVPVNAKAKVVKKDQRMVKTTDSSSMEISTESAATVVSKIPNAERVLEESMSVKAKMDQCVAKATETTGLVEASNEPAATVSKIPTEERVLKVPVNAKAKVVKKDQRMVKTIDNSLMEISTESAATVVLNIPSTERVLEEPVNVQAKMNQCVAKTIETGLVEASKDLAATVPKNPMEERVLKVPVIANKDQRIVKTTDSSLMEISTESAATVVSKIPNSEKVLEEPVSVKTKMDPCGTKETETTGLVEASKETAATVPKIPTEGKILKVPTNSKAKIAKKDHRLVTTVDSSFMTASKESAATFVSKIPSDEKVPEEPVSADAKIDQCGTKAAETGLVEASKEHAATVPKIPTEGKILKVPTNAKAKIAKKDHRLVTTADSSFMTATTFVSKIPSDEKVPEEPVSADAKIDQCVARVLETGLVEASKEPTEIVVPKIPAEVPVNAEEKIDKKEVVKVIESCVIEEITEATAIAFTTSGAVDTDENVKVTNSSFMGTPKEPAATVVSKIPCEKTVLELPVIPEAKTTKTNQCAANANENFVEVSKESTATVVSKIPSEGRTLQVPLIAQAKIVEKDQVVKPIESCGMKESTKAPVFTISGVAETDENVKVTNISFVEISKEPAATVVPKIPSEKTILEVPVNPEAKTPRTNQNQFITNEKFVEVPKELTATIVSSIPTEPKMPKSLVNAKEKNTVQDQCQVKVTESCFVEVANKLASTMFAVSGAAESDKSVKTSPKATAISFTETSKQPTETISIQERASIVPVNPKENITKKIHPVKITESCFMNTSKEAAATASRNPIEKMPEVPVDAKPVREVVEHKLSSLASKDNLDGSTLDISYAHFSSGIKLDSSTLGSKRKADNAPVSSEKKTVKKDASIPSNSEETTLKQNTSNSSGILPSTESQVYVSDTNLTGMPTKNKAGYVGPVKLLLANELDRITSTEPVFTVFSSAQNMDVDVLATPIVSSVKLPGQDVDLSLISNMVTSVTDCTTTTVSISCGVPTPVTLSTVSSNTDRQKTCLFTFNEDAEAVNRDNINTSEIFHTRLGLEDISPTKLPLASNQSLDFIASSTSMADISNSMSLVQTLGTSAINFDVSDTSEEPNKQNFGRNFVTRVTEISCFVDKESTADHNYTLGDPLLGGNNEDRNILTTGLSLSNSPEDYQLNESHLEDLSFNESHFIEENGALEEFFLPCKKEKPDFEIDHSIPKPEDIQNSIKHLNMLADNSQSGQQKNISVDSTLDDTNNPDCSVNLGIDYAVSKLLFLRDGEVTSQNPSFASIADIDNIIEPDVSSIAMEETKQLEIPSADNSSDNSISSTLPAYSSCISSDTQKVVVEPIEQYSISSVDQLGVSKNVEKPKPNTSRKYAELLECVKKDASKQGNSKAKVETVNFTVRRNNRTPVFPPKKKTVTQQHHTKGPSENKKTEILLFETNITKPHTSSEPGRIRVKKDLIKTAESKPLLNNPFEYINEHDQNIAREVVVPFSKPSPGKKNDVHEKNVEVVATKRARFDSMGKDYIMENILNHHTDSHKSPIQDAKVLDRSKKVDLIDTNKKRKPNSNDNERQDAKRPRKPDDAIFDKNRNSSDAQPSVAPSVNNKSKSDELFDKLKQETNVHKSKNDELFDKLKREGNVNRVLAQTADEQNSKKDTSNANSKPSVHPHGHSMVSDPRKKERHHPPQPKSAHNDPSTRLRDNNSYQKYYPSGHNVPLDRRYAKKRHFAGSIINNPPKSYVKNYENSYNSKSDPCTTRDYKSRDRRMSTEQPKNLFHNSSKPEKTDKDQFSWIKQVDPLFGSSRLDLFVPTGSKSEDTSPRK